MNLKRQAAVILAASLLMLSGCGTIPDVTPEPTPAVTASPEPTQDPAIGRYTLRESLSSLPTCWSALNWRTDGDRYLLDYTISPMLRIQYGTRSSELPTWYWEWEMAQSVEDITGSWTDREAWGIDASETGRVWRIRLNPDACWDDENHTPITAADFVESMHQCLDPQVQSLRANIWTSGECAILGAAAYHYAGNHVWHENVDGNGCVLYPYDSWVSGRTGQYTTEDGLGLWFSLETPLQVSLSGNSLGDYYRAGYLPEEIYTGLADMAGEDGFIPVTESSISLLFSFTGSESWGEEKLSDLAGYVFYPTVFPATDWNGVGLLAEDDHTLIYICENSVSEYAFLLGLTTPWLVYSPFSSDPYYASSPETTVSCGPYRLVSCTEDGVTLERNESWYGYRDGMHKDAYCADCILAIPVQNGEEQELFASGELDLLHLTEEDFPNYRDADNLISLESTYVSRLILVTDRTTLQQLQNEAGEYQVKVCLALDSFREGLSLAFDRNALAKATVPGGSAAPGLLNRQYYLTEDSDDSSVYRDTDAGIAALCRGYGVSWGEGQVYTTLDDVRSVNIGYDPERAKACFSEAFDKLVSDGVWGDYTRIELRCAVSGNTLSPLQAQQNAMMQAYLDEAVAGTGFEGKLTLQFCCMDDPCAAVSEGKIEMAMGAWGGAAFGTWNMMQCWCDPSINTIQERCGFDPAAETLCITLNDTMMTRTYQHWSQSIADGGEFSTDPDQRLHILSELEAALLQRRCCIPLFSLGQAVVLSGKADVSDLCGSTLWSRYDAEQVRLTCDDAEWDAVQNP